MNYANHNRPLHDHLRGNLKSSLCMFVSIVTMLCIATGVVWKQTVYRELLESNVKDILGAVSEWILFIYSSINYPASSLECYDVQRMMN
jgi:hypothetical protein